MTRHLARRLLEKASHSNLYAARWGLSVRRFASASQILPISSQNPLHRICRQDACIRLGSPLWDIKQFSTISPQSGGIIEIPLAQTGEGIADCELLTWHISEGDEVEEFQPLCSVQSDKAAIEITSRYKGKVSRLNFMPGDIVKVGEILLELISGHDEIANTSHDKDFGDATDSKMSFKKKVLATPAIRNLAHEYGINIEDVSGSGKEGRVLKEDLVKHLANKEGLNQELTMISEIAPKPEIGEEAFTFEKPRHDQAETSYDILGKREIESGDKIIHLRGYQRSMAKAMTAAGAIPHFYLVDDYNVDSLATLRKNLKDTFADQGLKVTYLPFMIKALSVAMVKYPLVNSTCNADATELCCRGSHNIGVAVATCHGLAVPNIKNVQSLSILEIAEELSRLIEAAAKNQLCPNDISGGTITVSNFGSMGGRIGYPILNLPEVAIVALGRIQKAPFFNDDGSMKSVLTMHVTWGADHRVLDGAMIANVCRNWKALVEHPDRLIIYLK